MVNRRIDNRDATGKGSTGQTIGG